MKVLCPHCFSDHIVKCGVEKSTSKQRLQCQSCKKKFFEFYDERGVQFTPEEKEFIISTYRLGASALSIGKHFGCREKPIFRVLKAAKVELNPSGNRKRMGNPHAFADLDEHSIYWLGFLYADGHLTKESGQGTPALSIGLQRQDESHLYKLKYWLDSDCVVSRGKNREVSSFWCSNKFLASDLLKLGMGESSLERIAQEEFQFNRHFWRGAVDGDGSLFESDGSPYVGFCGGTVLVYQFRQFVLQSVGKFPNDWSKKGKDENFRQTAIGGWLAIQLMKILYEDSKVHLDRKKNKCVELCKKYTYSNKPLMNCRRCGSTRIIKNGKSRGMQKCQCRVCNYIFRIDFNLLRSS